MINKVYEATLKVFYKYKYVIHPYSPTLDDIYKISYRLFTFIF